MKRKVLITGGAGFIGANFVHYWIKHHAGDGVVVLDALTYAGNLENLTGLENNPEYRFVHGNICDEKLVEKLIEEEGIDTVVHFAAESHVDRSITGPDPFIETNIVGTHTLLKAAKKIWLDRLSLSADECRFHHISTDEVYGSLASNDPPFKETTPYAPNSPYAASKAASDHLVRAYHHTYGLPVTTSNCSNNYGPYQYPEKLIPLMLTNILDNVPIPVYGDGLNVRDWLFVEDHCRGIELVIEKGKLGETYNIGGNNEWKNIDIVRLVCDEMEKEFKKDKRLFETYTNSVFTKGKTAHDLITFVKDRPGHDRRYAINAAKIEKELDYSPKEDFATGIQKTIKWYLKNEGWWRKLQQNHA